MTSLVASRREHRAAKAGRLIVAIVSGLLLLAAVSIALGYLASGISDHDSGAESKDSYSSNPAREDSWIEAD